GNDGLLTNGFENTMVTSEAAHTGMYSLKFDLPANRDPHDGFVGTKRYLFDSAQTNLYSSNVSNHDISHLTGINPGDIIRLSVWVKADSLQPDSADANPTTWAVGFTPGFFEGNGNNIGYNPVMQNDYQFKFPHVTSFGWTQYYLDVTVPSSSNALEVRLHVYARFTGKIYFDDLEVQKIGVTSVNNNHEMMPSNFQVFQNYPNPFNPTTTINFALPQSSNVKIVIYDMLGREVRTLVNGDQVAGVHSIVWDGRNNFGSQVASGTYIYRVVAGSYSAVKKMIMLK
ncbi:MAG: FlgD immunoglobulin-like domain containing protein, partial [Ignavibacteriaceae bacterium]